MPDAEPLYHQGEHVGWQIEADDGVLIGLDLDEQIVTAFDPAIGALVDHGEYALVDDDDDADPYEIEQRLGALEDYAAAPPEPVYVPYPVVPEVDEQRQQLDLDAQAAHLEARLGRPLLLSEKRAIGQQLTEAEIGGEDRVDIPAAVERLRQRGEAPLDLDSGSLIERREARQEYARQRIADQERLDAHERGEDDLLDAEAPPSKAAYDLDSREERQAYVMDRLRGATDPSATYSTEQLADEQLEYEEWGNQ